MNKIIVTGRLTKDPDIRYTAAELCIARFAMAVSRDKEETDYFNMVAFGKAAEIFEKHTKKGTKLLITGRLQNNNYTNKDGTKVYGNEIVVEALEFCEKKEAFFNVPDTEEPLPY